MSLSGVTFSGLASGLDTRAIVDALVAVERRPIFLLQEKKQGLNRSKSLFADFQSKLEALQEKAKGIKDIGNFLAFSATTDNEDKFFSVEASESAAPGSYNVKINSQAQGTVMVSTGSADKDTTQVVDGQTFSLSFGDGESIDIVPSGPLTLQDLANEINATIDANTGAQQTRVQASVLDTGISGANRYKLVLSATEEGADNGFTVTNFPGSGQTFDFLTAMSGNPENTTATNASLSINGVAIERPTNTISDAIAGVTLNLKGSDLGATTTKVTVTTDTSKTSEKVREFVDAYNEVVDFVESQNALSEDGEANSPLFGDITLRTVRSSLRGILGDSVSTGNDAYALLSQVGIKADTQGKLTFTESEFADALTEDSAAVKKIFSLEGTGIAGSVFNLIDTLNDSVDGIFKARLDSFDRQIRDADKSIDAKERRLEDFEQAQIERFAALEQAMAQLQAQGNAFSSFNPPTIQ